MDIATADATALNLDVDIIGLERLEFELRNVRSRPGEENWRCSRTTGDWNSGHTSCFLKSVHLLLSLIMNPVAVSG